MHAMAHQSASSRCCSLRRQAFAPCSHARRARASRAPVRVSANLLSKLFGGGGGEQQQKAAAPAPSSAPGVKAEMFLMQQNQAKPEFPPYSVIRRGTNYDLRLYEVFPVIEMDYARREEGYAYLGAYIDGENETSTRFSYAQPVIMRYYPEGDKVMQMFLGTRFLPDGTTKPGVTAAEALTQLPAPTNPAVRISVAGGELVAVLKFEGYITPATAEKYKAQLIAALKADGLSLADEEAAGYFRCAQYGPVYQLGGRLNEMMLRVKA